MLTHVLLVEKIPTTTGNIGISINYILIFRIGVLLTHVLLVEKIPTTAGNKLHTDIQDWRIAYARVVGRKNTNNGWKGLRNSLLILILPTFLHFVALPTKIKYNQKAK